VVTTDVMTSDSDTGREDPQEADESAASRRTEEVRIVGAERARDSAAAPLDDEAHGAGPHPRAPGGPEDAAPEDGAPENWGLEDGGPEDWGAEDWGPEDWGPEDWAADEEPQLPHWTEAPTGEIPAVLSRTKEAADDDPWTSFAVPSWREEGRDWEHDDTLGTSLLGLPGEDPLPIRESSAEERQPWSFDLEGVRAAGDGEDADGPAVTGWTVGDEGAWTAGEEGEEEEGEEEVWTTGDEGAWTAGIEETDEEADDAGDTGLEAVGEKTAVLSSPARAGIGASDARSDGSKQGELPALPAKARTGAAEARPGAAEARPGAAAARTGAIGTLSRHAGVSQRAGRNIPAAVASGLVVGGLALLAFHFGPAPSMVVVTAVVAAAAVEAYAAFRRAYRPASLLGIAAVVGLLVGTYNKPFVALPAVAVILVAATFLWHLLHVDRRADPVRSTAATLFVFCWVGVFGSYAALLLAPSLFPDRTGIAYLLGALIAAVAYDVGALVVGAWVGHHPLSAVSPGKTWEGIAGGAVAAIVLAVGIVHLVHPWTLGQALVLGVVVAVVSPVGDLCESLVKRHLGLKDMGRLLPGHGGLLDRVDGILFVLPATYYLVRAFGHG
jgi:phosphatidate cytidylyltransferase